MSRKLFVNLPISNLDRSVTFFKKLGFTFNPQFTDEKATCMIVNDDAFFMLMVEERFKDFTPRSFAAVQKGTSGIYSISANSRKQVDETVEAALLNGGNLALPPQDHGWMYLRSFYDLDGYHWEVAYMDLSKLPKS